MTKVEAIERAKQFLNQLKYPCNRILSSRLIKDADTIAYYCEQSKIVGGAPTIWIVNFELYPPSTTTADSHGIATFVVDPDTGKCGIVR